MTRNKLLSALLCLLLLAFYAPQGSCAAPAGTLTVGETGGARGDTVSLDVTLDRVGGIAGGGFNVVYDSAALTLLSATAGVAGGSVNAHYAENAVRISFAGTTALKQAGSLLTLTFRIGEDAPFGLLPVTLEKVKFYDETAAEVSAATVNGGVSVLAVELSVSSGSCLPGESVKLEVSLSDGLYPAGGEFDIAYNSRLLSAGSVKGAQKAGNAAIQFNYSVDAENSVIHISWAAAESAGAPVRLCTVIFAVSEAASGNTGVSIRNMKAYDENGRRMDCAASDDGVVTVVDRYNGQPTIYVVGGKLEEDGVTSVVQVAVDGAGIICGGAFQLLFDPAVCELIDFAPQMSCVAVNPTAQSDGTLFVSWAEDGPALDNETVLRLTFRMKAGASAALELRDTALKDKAGADVPDIVVNGGKIGLSTRLQDPVARLVRKETAMELQATLYDAQFCGAAKTGAAQVVMASYSGERIRFVSIPSQAIVFDRNGIARVTVDAAYNDGIDRIRAFILDAEGAMTPMCASISVNTAD